MTRPSPLRILVVDHDQKVRNAISSVLRRHGHSVVEATDGREALELMIADRADELSLILLELELPIMSGEEFLGIAKSYIRLARIPVAVMSDARPTELLRHGTVAAFLQKPFDEEEIVNLIGRHARS